MANAPNGTNNLALTVSYETAFGEVTITSEDVKKYLVRGGGNITDQEIKLFMELCKYQRLNPFTGEAYPIKFGNDFQLVVGYEAYKRRAEEHDSYMGRKSGIVVLRGNDVIQKEGTCLYPGEELIGGWCRVFREKGGNEEETFKEVSFKEYDKGQANWKTKPCTMIDKVAVSQALRAAFPKDYAGLYTPEEMGVDGNNGYPGAIDADYTDVEDDDPIITQEQRQELFAKTKAVFGGDANKALGGILAEFGRSSTTDMPTSVWAEVMNRIDERSETQEDPDDDAASQ